MSRDMLRGHQRLSISCLPPPLSADPLPGASQRGYQLLSEHLLLAGEDTGLQGRGSPPSLPPPLPHTHFAWYLQTEPDHSLLQDSHSLSKLPQRTPCCGTTAHEALPGLCLTQRPSQSPRHNPLRGHGFPNRMWGCRSPEGRSHDLACVPRTSPGL